MRYSLYFVMGVLAIGFVYAFPRLISLPPQSIHQWRQADGASIARNFYQDTLCFDEPQIQNLQYTGDPHAAGEWPLTYYLAGLIYRITGHEEWVLRLIHWLFFMIGLWSFGSLFRLAGADDTTALCCTVLFYTSNVLAYYSLNYLPDAPALGMSLLALYSAALWYKRRVTLALWLFAVSASLAGMIKLTSFIPVLAILGAALISYAGSKKRHAWQEWWVGGLPVVAVLACRVWISQYNQRHDSTYFMASIRPIWDASLREQWEVIRMMSCYWSTDYFNPGLLCLTGLGAIFILFHRQWLPPAIRHGFYLMTAGTVSAFLLWFSMFRDHDYYAVPLFAFPAVIWVLFWYVLNKKRAISWQSIRVRTCLIVICIVSVGLTSRSIRMRYDNPRFTSGCNPALLDKASVSAWLAASGVEPTDRVISIPDPSPNITLYFLNRKGWTNYNFGNRLNRDTMQRYVRDLGARFLIVHDSSWLRRPELMPYMGNLAGTNQGMSIFRLTE